MHSHLTSDFISCFAELPPRIKELASKNYKLWKRDPAHPSLQFKRVGIRKPVYSIRVGIGWRALGLRLDDTIIWFWIGPHARYDRIIPRM